MTCPLFLFRFPFRSIFPLFGHPLWVQLFPLRRLLLRLLLVHVPGGSCVAIPLPWAQPAVPAPGRPTVLPPDAGLLRA